MRRKDGRRVLLVRKAELAERKGVTRGAVTRAAKGVLKPACSADGLIDMNHEAVRRWLGRAAAEPSRFDDLLFRETAISAAQFAKVSGIALRDVLAAIDEELSDAMVPAGHVAIGEFAARSGATVDEVVVACDRELEPALVRGGRLDIGHPASLAFFAARPFERTRTGDPVVPTVNGSGYLACACEGDRVDVTHPAWHGFLARCLGRVPTQADVGL